MFLAWNELANPDTGGDVGELSEEKIETAEAGGSTHHGHEGVTALNHTLAQHLRQVHGLDPPATLSRTTLEGLHDRLHEETKAIED